MFTGTPSGLGLQTRTLYLCCVWNLPVVPALCQWADRGVEVDVLCGHNVACGALSGHRQEEKQSKRVGVMEGVNEVIQYISLILFQSSTCCQ